MINRWACHLAIFLGFLAIGSIYPLQNSRAAEPENKAAAVNYGRPFEPPTHPAFIPLPPGNIEPTGWLRDWALTVRDGYTGHADEVHPAFKQAWAADYKMTGEQLTFWDRGAWPYEGGGYWFDGLTKLAYALHDESLIEKAKSRFAPVADNMNDHGILFMWWLDRNKPEDMEAAIRHAGGEANAWPIWANSLFGRALCGYYLASEDKKALRALELAYSGDLCWTRKEVPPTNIWPAFETYTWTGNEVIKKAMSEFFKTYKIEPAVDKSVRMIDIWYNRPPDEKRTWFKQPNHGVSFNEGTIPWAVGYLWTGDRAYLDAPLKWYDIIERGDDGMQPQGVPVGDENSGPTGSLRGTETCDVAGFIWSQITLLRVSGEGRLADRVERAVFNAGPAVASRDCKTHVYHQTPNRINATAYGDPAYQYHKTQMPLCCTAAQNRILPNYLAHMWMATYDNGLAAVHYGPCKVSALAGDRVPVELDCRTDYPFNDSIEIAVNPASEAEFPLSFRIPNWCANPEITINDLPCKEKADARGFVRIARQWKADDRVRLRFPMTVRVKMGHDNNANDTPYATASYGPLLFAFPIADTKDANTPDDSAKWKYAFDAPADKPGFEITVHRSPMPEKWNWQIDAPLTLQISAQSFDWNPAIRPSLPVNPVGPNDASPYQPDIIMTQLPKQPIPTGATSERISLVPYGCTKFRVSMFPVTERASKTWQAEETSHANQNADQ
jgi:hypothetical protein